MQKTIEELKERDIAKMLMEFYQKYPKFQKLLEEAKP
jgi:hypothetical protein